jgi:alkylation response protein AidB-like acyl-CoA dehydrogenase
VAQEVLDELTRRLAATAADVDRRAVFPDANFLALNEAGLLGLTVETALGGRGAGLGEALRVLRAVARGEPSTALILFMTYCTFADSSAEPASRVSRWPRHLYERLAREAASGISLIGTLRVEPELGTPVRGGLPKTVARETPGGWRLSGHKIYSTGSTGLRWFAVWARTDEPAPRIGTFLVRSDTPGIRIEPTWDHLGMRASVSHEVVFEEALTPLDHAVDVRKPAEWAGQAAQKAGGLAAWNALAISTIYGAVAEAARDWLVGYLNHRAPSNLGAPLATLPRVQEKVGEIEALLHTNRFLLDTTTRRVESRDPAERPTSVEINLVKYTATRNAIRAVEIGLELTGNPGLSRHNPLERHHRDVLCSRIHSPQDDTILISAGWSALIAASPP